MVTMKIMLYVEQVARKPDEKSIRALGSLI